jgi:hypothetical protein
LVEYLKTHQATPEMRRVRFSLSDRLTLIPVEVVAVLLPTLIAAIALFFVSSLRPAVGAITAVLAGVVLFPILLPWLPTHNFSTKGLILGGVVALPFAVATFQSMPSAAWWWRIGGALTYLLAMPPVTAFLALNFTGSTTFTSKTGVKCEMYAYIPTMAWMFGAGIALTVAFALTRLLRG